MAFAGAGFATFAFAGPDRVVTPVAVPAGPNDVYLVAGAASPSDIVLRTAGPVTAAITVLPGVGVLTLTGFAPTVLTPRVAKPGVGVLTLVGVAPSVRVPRVVVPPVGALLLTGFAPAVLTPRVVKPGLGALALAGFAPVIRTPRVMLPGVGAVALTGIAPSVLTPRVVRPSVGVLALAGLAPTVLTPQVARPAAGGLVLTGLAPTVIATVSGPATMLPDVGSLVLEGFAPLVTGDPVTAVPAGGFMQALRRRKRQTVWVVAETFAPSIIVTVTPPQRFHAVPMPRPAVAVADTGALVLAGYAPAVVVTAPQPEHEPDATGEPRAGGVVRPAGIEQAARASFPIYQPDDQGHAQPTHFSGPRTEDSAVEPETPPSVPAWLASPIVVDVGYAALLLDGFAPTIHVTTRPIADPWSPDEEDDAAVLWAAYDLLVTA